MSSPQRLLLFAKIPAPGRVKTRLCPPLSPDQAADLYEAFLRDILEKSLQAPEKDWLVELHYYGGQEQDLPPWIGGLEGLVLHPQVGESLAERMASAFARSFQSGASRVVLRNTDSPLLPADRIRDAFQSLRAPGVDLVLGPDLGGGYYLVGLERELPGLFELDALGSHGEGGTVLVGSCAWARQEGLSLCLLREEGDVDEPADLQALRAVLVRGDSERERAPHTARVLLGFGNE